MMEYPYSRFMLDGYKTLVVRWNNDFDKLLKDKSYSKFFVVEKGIFKDLKIIGYVDIYTDNVYDPDNLKHALLWKSLKPKHLVNELING